MKAQQLAVAGTGIAAALLLALPALAQASRPHPQITITNQRTVPLSNFAIATPGDQPRLVAKLAKPLAPGKSVALKLNKPQGCAYTVQARFEDEAESQGYQPWELTLKYTSTPEEFEAARLALHKEAAEVLGVEWEEYCEMNDLVV